MVYNIVKYFFKIFLIPFIKVEIRNHEEIPVEGPVVLVANHVSNWDPIILGISIKRKLHCMAKEELFDIFLVGTIIRKMGTFPVKRGAADRAAIKESLKVLKNKNILFIFPEGTRSKTGELQEFQSGVAYIAHKGNAPIIPVGLINTTKIKMTSLRTKIIINIGEKIDLTKQYSGKINNEQIQEITGILQKKVADLLK